MDKQAILRQLREKLAEARTDSEAILDEAHAAEGGVEVNLAGDLLERYTNSDDVVAETIKQIETVQRSIDMERAEAIVVDEAAAESNSSSDEVRSAYSSAFGNYLRSGQRGLSNEESMLLRAQTVSGDGSQGGYLVEPMLMRMIIEQLKAFGGVREAVKVISTAKGAQLRWPTLDDTANEGYIVGEEGPITADAQLVFGEAVIDAYNYASGEIRESWVLMQDEEFDLTSKIRDALVTRLGRVTNRHFTTGTGTGQPDGLVTGATSAVTTAGTLFTHDELIDLVYSLDPAYMNNTKWMFNHTTAGEMRKVVDGDGNKVWQMSLKDGEPDRLLGYPMVQNQHMPDVAPGNVPVLFGDYKEGYMVRDVRDVSIIRLDELYAKELQSGFFAWMRSDGTKINTSAYRALTMAP